jgi:hypothetical protein
MPDAMVYFDEKHQNRTATRGIWGLWGKSQAGRRSCRLTTGFNDPNWGTWDGHKRGEVWSSTLFEIYRKLGRFGQAAAIRRHAEAFAAPRFRSEILREIDLALAEKSAPRHPLSRMAPSGRGWAQCHHKSITEPRINSTAMTNIRI